MRRTLSRCARATRSDTGGSALSWISRAAAAAASSSATRSSTASGSGTAAPALRSRGGCARMGSSCQRVGRRCGPARTKPLGPRAQGRPSDGVRCRQVSAAGRGQRFDVGRRGHGFRVRSRSARSPGERHPTARATARPSPLVPRTSVPWPDHNTSAGPVARRALAVASAANSPGARKLIEHVVDRQHGSGRSRKSLHSLRSRERARPRSQTAARSTGVPPDCWWDHLVAR